MSWVTVNMRWDARWAMPTKAEEAIRDQAHRELALAIHAARVAWRKTHKELYKLRVAEETRMDKRAREKLEALLKRWNACMENGPGAVCPPSDPATRMRAWDEYAFPADVSSVDRVAIKRLVVYRFVGRAEDASVEQDDCVAAARSRLAESLSRTEEASFVCHDACRPGVVIDVQQSDGARCRFLIGNTGTHDPRLIADEDVVLRYRELSEYKAVLEEPLEGVE